ncbi:protein pxr1-like [Nicotiana tomentosiformis]|uniref:protein pxr1-like n=1 Tax=Nicotiana tomentosiformis TaxID=4098 RepID=UPI00388CEBD5
MANTSENPSSPPKESIPTPSTTPSTTPISKKERFKMLARKVVAGGEQIKKINEKLKAGQADEPQKSDESFKSATEGEETVAANLETRFVLVGTVVGVEIAEYEKIGGKNKWRKEKESEGARGNVREMGKEVDESSPTPSSVVKVPGTSRANKKRKVTSSIPVETPPTRGRTTRSQKKQSEAELEKAVEESKRKVAAKGNKKVGEPVEAVKIEEMDLVLHDEEEAEEMEVVTPKAKKIKTSIKKSVSKTKSAGPSTLAK